MPDKLTDQPMEWSIEDGLFIGYVLVDLPPVPNGRGILGKPADGWLHWAQDLRDVTTIRESDGDHLNRTGLYCGSELVGIVNAPFADLLPHWKKARISMAKGDH